MKSLPLNGHAVRDLLNGFLCVYKARDVSVSALKKCIISAICDEGNSLDEVIVPEITVPIVKPHRKTGALVVVGQRNQIDYVLHPFMSGQVFRPEDIRLNSLHNLEPSSSGVCVFGINDGCDEINNIRNRAWINEYYAHLELGLEKDKHEFRGKIVAKARYDHVTNHQIRKILSKIKLEYKKLSYELANVDLQSQEAFNLIRLGAPRPRLPDTPIVFNIDLKNFNSPHLTLNIQAVHENGYFLRALMHEIGCNLETLACPRRLRCIRQGPFLCEHALLQKQLQLIPIIKNIQMSNKIMKAALIKDPNVIQVIKSEDYQFRSLPTEFGLQELDCLSEPEDCLHIGWGRSYK